VSAPRCYSGSKTLFGVGESVQVTLDDFDTSSNKGVFHLAGSGVAGFTCSSRQFTKAGQSISADLGDCLPNKVVVESIDYCSDQDAILVSVNDENIPWGMGKVTVSLAHVACSTEESATTVAAVASSSCSGSGIPDVSASRCYSGSKKILGVGESVQVTLDSFDTSSNKGVFHLSGSGVTGFTCSSRQFTKDGQSISADLSDCLPKKVVVESIDYCSDQDAIQVSVNDENIPWGLGKLTVSLGHVACSTEESAIQV